MSDSPSPSPDLLDGWKSIADYLGKSVRTAQRWRAEYGLPVHRLGARDGENVFAYKSELDAWRLTQGSPGARGNNHPIENGPGENDPTTPARKGARPARVLYASLAVLLVVAVAGVALSRSRVPPQPAHWTVSGASLIVYDAEMRELWRKTFDQPLEEVSYFSGVSATRVDPPGGFVATENPRAFPRVQLADLEGDGFVEVLFVVHHRAGKGRELLCLEFNSKERWSYRATSRVSFGDAPAEAPDLNGVVARTRQDGGTDIYVQSTNESWFPSLVVRLNPAGQPSAEYWSNGHVAMLVFATIDGRNYVLAGGPHNETKGGSLAIFDEDRFGGSAPATSAAYRCRGCPAGEPEHFLVFPRTPMIDARGGFPAVADVTIHTTGETVVMVNQGSLKPPGEAHAWQADALYRLDPRFRVIGAEYFTVYRRLQRYFENTGQMKPEESVGDEARLWPVLRWNRDRQAFDRIDGPER